MIYPNSNTKAAASLATYKRSIFPYDSIPSYDMFLSYHIFVPKYVKVRNYASISKQKKEYSLISNSLRKLDSSFAANGLNMY